MIIRLALAIGLSLLAICHDASARQFRVLYSFCAQTNCTDGQLPASGLIADGQGNLYGTTIWGGSHGGGVVFELVRGKRNDWSYQVLYNFCSQQYCVDGYGPQARLIMDTSGNIFGTTRGLSYPDLYPSTIFELSPDANRTHWTLTTFYSFCRQKSGGGNTCGYDHFSAAISALTYAGQASGALYDGKAPLFGYGGTRTAHGGSNFVYRYSPGEKGNKIIHVLQACCFFASDPVFGNDGLLYGTTVADSQYGQGGTAFALNVATGAETVLHNFCEQPQCSDGGEPSGGLTRDAAGNLYGEAVGGPPTSYCGGCGIVYRLTPQNGQYEYTILHNLCGKPNCSDGMDPEFGLIQDSSGTLYGATQSGGGTKTIKSAGTVFEAGGTLRALHHFCSEANCGDGAYPNGPLLMSKGGLYGTTTQGGANYDLPNVWGGTIFEITN